MMPLRSKWRPLYGDKKQTCLKELKTRMPVKSNERNVHPNVHGSETSSTGCAGLKRLTGRRPTGTSVRAAPLMCDAVSLWWKPRRVSLRTRVHICCCDTMSARASFPFMRSSLHVPSLLRNVSQLLACLQMRTAARVVAAMLKWLFSLPTLSGGSNSFYELPRNHQRR